MSQRAGEVVVTRRGEAVPRAWLLAAVQLSPDEATSRDLVRRPEFAPDRTVVLTVGADAESRLGAPARALRAIGLLSPSVSEGLVSAEDGAALQALMPGTSGTDGSVDRVESLVDASELVSLRVQTAGPRVLVLPDAPYPGWSAQVNGIDEPVWRANVGHRAVLIRSAGEHEVEFRYRSTPFEVGRVVSLVSVGVLCIGAAGLWIRRRGR